MSSRNKSDYDDYSRRRAAAGPIIPPEHTFFNMLNYSLVEAASWRLVY
jgi:hypothetical protein